MYIYSLPLVERPIVRSDHNTNYYRITVSYSTRN